MSLIVDPPLSILAHVQLEPEAPLICDHRPAASWPANGEVRWLHVALLVGSGGLVVWSGVIVWVVTSTP